MKWTGHILRMSDNKTVKHVFGWEASSRRSRGRPKKRWMDCVEEDLHRAGISRYGITTSQWRSQDFSLGGAYRGAEGARRRRRRVGWGAGRGCAREWSGEGAVSPPQKMFDYLILKWRILMHISGILTYLF